MAEGKKEYEIKKISDYEWEVPKHGNMKVPVRIYASEKLLKKIEEDGSIEQGINVATLPGIQGKSIMLPDAHRGYGMSIGGVAGFDAENGIISPSAVGFDQNCGVRLLTTNLEHDEVEEKIHPLLDSLFANVPAGVGGKSIFRLSKEELDEVLNKGVDWAIKNKYATKEDKEHCEEFGRLEKADASKVSEKAKDRGKNQLGTLGAGNHFLEIQTVNEIFDKKIAKKFGIIHKGQVVVMIHTGSRGLGHQTCSDFLRRMEKEDPKMIDSLPDKDLAYAKVGTNTAEDYFKAMCAAANFAWTNRQLITYQTRKSFKEIFPKSELKLVYDVCHNIAKEEEYEINGKKKRLIIHRKGATRAFGPGRKEVPEVYRDIGQPIIIPGSMGTASYVLVGTKKAEQETFSSTAHGAGRNLSRHQALKQFRGEQIKADLEKRHIYLKAKSWKGIAEEAPLSYKDIDEVVKVSHEVGIGNLVARLTPLACIKG
ncbi:RtcB family protein [Candidatus Woesearchaeota archaeon]|nr:RtcB family protein [Candidatus Woesearchaeota archaeon]